MPRAVVTNEIAIINSPRVVQVSSIFDVPPQSASSRTWNVDLPLEERDWGVGLVVGPSGAGKSSVARALWPDHLVAGYDWDARKSVVDAFPSDIGVKDVVAALTAVGFSSPPSWLRPFVALSTGEQFRVTAARALAEAKAAGVGNGLVVLDEFTSVVDRQVAQVASHGVQKAARAAGTRLVAVTCHYDVLDWLQPDWVYEPHIGPDGRFAWRSLQRRPTVQLDIAPVSRDAWPLFRDHHYMSGDLMRSARCVGGWLGDRLVAFGSWMHFPHARIRDMKMAHRYVVLPEFQGLGLGSAMAEWTGEYLAAQGYRFRFVSVHPSIVGHFNRSPKWRLCARPSADPTRRSLKSGATKSMNWDVAKARRLMTYSFEYVPTSRGVLAPAGATPGRPIVTLGRR
jgi:ABC-type ATPase involved in cell division/GNAT superfamily N-acetyltransferase